MINKVKGKMMAKGENKTAKKYGYKMVLVCKNCGTESRNPWPCVNCSEEIFVREYRLVAVT